MYKSFLIKNLEQFLNKPCNNAPNAEVHELGNFDRVVVALDPDASKKSLEHAKELSNYVSDVKVLKLTDDLKYKNLEDFKKLEEILNG